MTTNRNPESSTSCQTMPGWFNKTESFRFYICKLQEIVKGKEAWCAAVHGVAKSWTWQWRNKILHFSMPVYLIIYHSLTFLRVYNGHMRVTKKKKVYVGTTGRASTWRRRYCGHTAASTRGKAQTDAAVVCGLVSLVPKRLLPIWDYEGPRDSHGAKSLWLAPTGHSRS